MLIAITGASGFLGSHLAMHFVKGGHEVLALKRRASSLERLGRIYRHIRTIDVDVPNLDNALRRAGQIKALVHTASIYGRKGESASEVIAANVLFGVEMYEAAARCGVSCFINVASALPPSLNAYSLSKHQLGEWGRQLVRLNDTRFVNLKVEHFYGPGDDLSKFTAHVINSCLRNVESLALSSGDQRRDFIYVQDVLSAIDTILNSDNIGSAGYAEYDIGTGHAITIKEFVETVRELTGASTRLDFGAVPYRDGEPMSSAADVRPILKLGWKPRFGLREGLIETVREERSR